ncbi:MAG: prolyl oligopeptidase family serine peptidase, partial [bacterium]
MTDDYFGTKVEDPYRWLEAGDDPAVQTWEGEQGAKTRGLLDTLPGRDALMAEYETLWQTPLNTGFTLAGNKVFWSRREAMANQPQEWVTNRATGIAGGHVYLDPNALSTDGTVALDWNVASPDGALIAYGTSEGGDEMSTLHVRHTDTLEDMPEAIRYTRSSSIAWLKDSSGFYYSRLPDPTTVPEEDKQFYRHIFFHKLGTPAADDPLVYGADQPKETWISVGSSSDYSTLFLSSSIDWAKNDLWMRPLDAPIDAPWVTLSVGEDGQTGGEVVGETLLLRTNVGHPRYCLMKAPLSSPDQRTMLIPEGPGVLEAFVVANGRLVVQFMENAYHHIRVYSLDGQLEREVELPTLGPVSGLTSNPANPRVLFGFNSFAYPPTTFELDVTTGGLTTIDSMDLPIDFSRYEAVQEWATSKDGTKIPMFLVGKKGFRDGTPKPTILYGYGGFEVSLTPGFSRGLIPWLESGGVSVTANLRGGGEFGSAWHEAGRLEKKQNVFDDYYACAEHLIASGITTSKQLAFNGGSNGGLLVGAAITQRPELAQAAICGVPLLDMLRY